MLNDREYWRPFSSRRHQQGEDEVQPALTSQASVYVHALDDTFSTSNNPDETEMPPPLPGALPATTEVGDTTAAVSSVSVSIGDNDIAASTNDDTPDADHQGSAMNEADEAAHLNFIDIDQAEDGDNRHRRSYRFRFLKKHTYSDVAGEAAFKSSDYRGNVRSMVWSVFRGRAMPLMPMLCSIAWTVFAVGMSYALKGWSPAEAKGECRAWCTPLSVDSDALSYVGFALFLLTSFRVQE